MKNRSRRSKQRAAITGLSASKRSRCAGVSVRTSSPSAWNSSGQKLSAGESVKNHVGRPVTSESTIAITSRRACIVANGVPCAGFM